MYCIPTEEMTDPVAICTERVEAKFHKGFHFLAIYVAICTERVEAKNTSAPSMLVTPPLQSARGVQRNRTASSPEKNPRKFMQTYCIFIHLDV